MNQRRRYERPFWGEFKPLQKKLVDFVGQPKKRMPSFNIGCTEETSNSTIPHKDHAHEWSQKEGSRTACPETRKATPIV